MIRKLRMPGSPEFFTEVRAYMKREKINQTELAQRMGRLDLAMPIYERLLPMLEDVVGFTYAHIPQWIAWTEQQAKDAADDRRE